MKRRYFTLLSVAVIAACVSGLSLSEGTHLAADAIPSRLADQEFWKIVVEFSEPNGSFHSDNLLSNEVWLQRVIPELLQRARPGRIYMGVGPEQNFTYIAALRPKMVFIVDVRRGNLDLHLMYKALFELSRDRADFVSRLFSKKRPETLNPTSTAMDIFNAFGSVERSDVLYRENLKAIQDQLVSKHGWKLSEEEVQGIKYVYDAFFEFGPGIQYSSTGSFGGRNQPSYADLMVATDENGQPRGYLASEQNFSILKDLESRNMLIPVVGNFAGPKAIRAVGKYLTEKGATVSAFYLSNVEQYLSRDSLWSDFCRNAATLPLDESSMFIRAVRGGRYGGAGFGFGLNSALGLMARETKSCNE
jgi:hypothetical protein